MKSVEIIMKQKIIAKNLFAIIIGDVSGKGTSAAFNMSQMKGIFHSLVQLNPSPGEFLAKANIALSQCLERNHFITTSYFLVDTKNKKINTAGRDIARLCFMMPAWNQLQLPEFRWSGSGNRPEFPL
jgi:hypothetical protein